MELFWLCWPSIGGSCRHAKLRDTGTISGGPGAIESSCSSRSEDTLLHMAATFVLLPLQRRLMLSSLLFFSESSVSSCWTFSSLGVDPGTSSLLRKDKSYWVEGPELVLGLLSKGQACLRTVLRLFALNFALQGGNIVAG